MEEGRTAFFSKELNKAATLTQNAIDIYRMEKIMNSMHLRRI